MLRGVAVEGGLDHPVPLPLALAFGLPAARVAALVRALAGRLWVVSCLPVLEIEPLAYPPTERLHVHVSRFHHVVGAL